MKPLRPRGRVRFVPFSRERAGEYGLEGHSNPSNSTICGSLDIPYLGTPCTKGLEDYSNPSNSTICGSPDIPYLGTPCTKGLEDYSFLYKKRIAPQTPQEKNLVRMLQDRCL